MKPVTTITLKNRTPGLLPLLALGLFPAVATLFSFYLEIWPHGLYVTSKVGMIVLPVLVWSRRGGNLRSIMSLAGVRWTNGLTGVGTGLLLGGVVIASYFLFLDGVISPEPVRAKLESLNLVKHFWLVGLFISLWNSGLEEWFWRGFLLERMQSRYSAVMAIALNGLLFGVHHFFILMPYVQGELALFFTCATMVAGAAWAFMRSRGVSLLDCWISHVIADLAIVAVGWILLQQALA